MLVYKINPKMSKEVDSTGDSTIKIDVPLESNFALDMSQDLLSSEKFFEKIKADVLPEIVDLEKIVIYPAVYLGVSEEDGITPMLSLADEIEINMHFRRRWHYKSKENYARVIADGWLTNDTYDWTTGQTFDEEGKDFKGDDFDPTNYDERSDLVGYLGFDDDDIYYQKTKVKKSFLRLMFYDSKDVLNKNLLTYSTSFLDSGKLFTKYSMIRNNPDLFKYVNESEAYDNEMALFEPGQQYDTKKRGDEKEEEIEQNKKFDTLRMSSMITLKDKYNDDASSDGFYIYLFKQDVPAERPIDLYLKAEFNNAKYGKTVNLMLPVKDGLPIRFGDEDFPKDFTIVEGDKQNFDFDKYYNSLYVNVKCKFDKTLKKYVYYFPWDPGTQADNMEEGKEYTVSNDAEKKKITLNFFEPKLNRVKVTRRS